MNKIILMTVIILGIIGVIIGGIFLNNSLKNRIVPIDCNKPIDVIFLKPSEIGQASDIANHINGVVVIPEENQIIGRSEVLLCPNFDVSKYIETGGLI